MTPWVKAQKHSDGTTFLPLPFNQALSQPRSCNAVKVAAFGVYPFLNDDASLIPLERNIKLIVEYDGTDFHGWQIQPGRRTVQGVLEEKLRTLLQEAVRPIGAGRTDAGVHAVGQVAHVRTHTGLSSDRIRHDLNSLLPEDIAVRDVEDVPLDFHARFDARSRRYRYCISRCRRAIGRKYSWYVSYNMDVERIREASSILLGRHDFTSFCVATSRPDRPFCTVTECQWTEEEEQIRLDITADRFLHSMVRVIVGTMVDVGRGRRSVEDVEAILRAKDRSQAGATAPAQGLCLMEVRYNN